MFKSKLDNKLRFNILAIVLIVIFCVSISPVTLQNDTYYTIKIGEHISNYGIDMEDPFSWHEDLNYTYPHWTYDVLTYIIYDNFGMMGIFITTCALASILGVMIYFVNSKISKNNIISFIITIGTMYMLKGYIAARAQLVTFILFILTIYFIEKFIENKKIIYAIRFNINSYYNCKYTFSSMAILFYTIFTIYRRIHNSYNIRYYIV